MQRAGKGGHLGRGGEAGIPHQRRVVVDGAGDERSSVGRERHACDTRAGCLRRKREHLEPTASDAEGAVFGEGAEDVPNPDRPRLAGGGDPGPVSAPVDIDQSGDVREREQLLTGRRVEHVGAGAGGHRDRLAVGTPRRFLRIGCVEAQPSLAGGDVDHGDGDGRRTAWRPPSTSRSDRTTCSPDGRRRRSTISCTS